MRRCAPPLLVIAATATALVPAAGAAKPCTSKGRSVKSGVYDGPIALYVGHTPPYSTRGKVALLRSQKEKKNPVSGSCTDPAGPSNYIPIVDGTKGWLYKGKAPKIGKSKTYKGNAKRTGSGFTTTIKATLKVKFASARRAKVSLSVVETMVQDDGTSVCKGKGSWTVRR